MPLEHAGDRLLKKFYRNYEFRQVPGDEQQIEFRRRRSDNEWEPLSFYDTIEEANERFAELLRRQEDNI